MISFRSKSEIGASVAILAALSIMLGLTAFLLFDRGADKTTMVRTAMKQRDKLEKDIADLEKTIKDQKAKVDAKIWKLSMQEIGPKALQTVTGFAKDQKLKLTAFRPQKANDVNGLTQLPFVISIEGSYPSILNFIRQIETSNSKLAPNLVQLSSTDGSSDQVTATIGVMAYTLPAPPEKSSSKKTQEKVNATQKEN